MLGPLAWTTLGGPPGPTILGPGDPRTELLGLALPELPMPALAATLLLLISALYFWRISKNLGQEALRRRRITRAFLDRSRGIEDLAPVVGIRVDEVATLSRNHSLLEAS